MTGTVVEIKARLDGYVDSVGRSIGEMWSTWDNQRSSKVAEWLELRNYLFATDTSTTSNSSNPWKNSTTTPKLCQIRDNLHSNYLSAMFPNDRWFVWEGYTLDDEVRDKTAAITAYMSNKIIESKFRDTASSLLFDYIDYGNAFCEVEWVVEQYENEDGEFLTGYIGPRAVRISPLDIVFNPLSNSFTNSPKITRKLLTMGEVAALAKVDEDWERAFNDVKSFRAMASSAKSNDFNKAVAFSVDGFGSYYEYLGSQYVEVMTFYGDYYDPHSGQLYENAEITVIDRCKTVKIGKVKSWIGKSNIAHAGWRKRPDNLYHMGPLENLIGLQYRIDHLENLKADAQDLTVHPMLKIIGDVDAFTWQPGGEIYIPGEGDVSEMGANLNGVISADNSILNYMTVMEEMAGAPKQAMGIRTPGEKTAFEVQSLDNAAGRIFQEKVVSFEINLLEPILNAMLAVARQNMNGTDVARVFDNDLGVSDFMSVTKDDITARGTLRPIGARHFSQQAQFLQNLNQMMMGGLAPLIAPHISKIQLARVVEDALGLSRYQLVRPNVAIMEDAETVKLAQQAQEQAQVEASTPTPGQMNVEEENF
jgi:hypothetical protein